MAAMSAFKAACVSEPSTTGFAVARIVPAIENRQADGYSFANARDYVLGHEVYRAEINRAVDNGWLVRNASLTLVAGPHPGARRRGRNGLG